MRSPIRYVQDENEPYIICPFGTYLLNDKKCEMPSNFNAKLVAYKDIVA